MTDLNATLTTSEALLPRLMAETRAASEQWLQYAPHRWVWVRDADGVTAGCVRMPENVPYEFYRITNAELAALDTWASIAECVNRKIVTPAFHRFVGC